MVPSPTFFYILCAFVLILTLACGEATFWKMIHIRTKQMLKVELSFQHVIFVLNLNWETVCSGPALGMKATG